MQDKIFITNELERLVNLINDTPVKKKKDNEYIHLLDEIVIKAKNSLSKIDHELIKKIISKIKDEHMVYLISRDFFKPAPHRNNFLIQLVDTSIIEKTIRHLFHKKSIGEVRLNEYFGVRLVSKFITQLNKSYKTNHSHIFNDNAEITKSINNHIINDLNQKLAYQNADNERLKDESESLRIQLIDLTTSYEQVKNQLNDKFKEEVKNTLGEFVSEAIAELRVNENKYNFRSSIWLVGGGIISIMVVITVFYLVMSMNGYMNINKNHDLSWPTLLYYIGKGVIVLSSLTALAFYCFKQSNAYVHESLKQGERVHAIRFGELCLNLYGNKIDENQIKTVFEDWNINSSTAFLSQGNNEMLDIPGNISNIIKSTIESVGKK